LFLGLLLALPLILEKYKVRIRLARKGGETYIIVLAVVVFGGDQRQQAVEGLCVASQPFLGMSV
jgi:hypothetical protein